ncbi:MAG: hypothetical protein QM770_07335 [Tepidisphaeraceae bacterium]
MGDLKHPSLMYLKAALLLLSGLIAVTIILLEHPSWRLAALLALGIWCFCRTYYFAFYVIEKYIDQSYRFAGLLDFAKYAMRRRRSGEG